MMIYIKRIFIHNGALPVVASICLMLLSVGEIFGRQVEGRPKVKLWIRFFLFNAHQTNGDFTLYLFFLTVTVVIIIITSFLQRKRECMMSADLK